MNERGLDHAAAIVQIIEMRRNYNGNRSMKEEEEGEKRLSWSIFSFFDLLYNCESVVKEENIEEDENVSRTRDGSVKAMKAFRSKRIPFLIMNERGLDHAAEIVQIIETR